LKDPGWLSDFSLVAESKKKITEQHPLNIQKEIDSGISLTLVDVREGEEWKKSRIRLPNVVHLSRVMASPSSSTCYPATLPAMCCCCCCCCCSGDNGVELARISNWIFFSHFFSLTWIQFSEKLQVVGSSLQLESMKFLPHSTLHCA